MITNLWDRKWRGGASSHQWQKKNAVGSILHPHPLLSSRVFPAASAAVVSGRSGSCPSPGLGGFLALCVNTCAQKRRAVSEWFGYAGPVVSQSAGVHEQSPLPPSWNTHTHTHKLQLPSRLMFNQSIGFLWLPDYSINHWAPVLMNFACVDEFLNRSAEADINRWLFLMFSQTALVKWNSLLSHAVHKRITDSYKPTPCAI